MAAKHLTNFYSYKVLPFGSAVVDQVFNGSLVSRNEEAGPIERQVQQHLTRGHQFFFQDRFRDALQEYLLAYGLIYRFLHPYFPFTLGPIILDRLRDLKVFDSVLSASAQVARYREVAGPDLSIVAPSDPPPELTRIVETLGAAGTIDSPPPAQQYYRQAVNYLRIGASKLAERFLAQAREANAGRDSELEARLFTAMAASHLQQAQPERAEELLSRAEELFQNLGLQRDRAAVSSNMGVLHTINGNVEAAAAAFQAAGNFVPLDLGRTMVQPLNPGTVSSMVRPMGSSGLGLILRSLDAEDEWLTIPATSTPDGVGARRLGVLVADKVVDVDLTADPVGDLTAKIYQPRRVASTLKELQTYEILPFNFVAYLGHIHGFIIPMAVGDCYLELGEFDIALEWYRKARDYPFLNVPIETPLVWLKMAKTYLRWGSFFYRGGDKPEATARYEKIIRLNRLNAPQVDPSSELYLTPVFDTLRTEVTAILGAARPIDSDAHNPAIAEVVLLAELNLKNIAAGIDFPLLSLALEQVPVFTFEYLQNVARYFAEHAIQAERTYITFKTSAEKETFTRSMLQNTVDLEQANERLEQKKVDIANQQKLAMDANATYAALQGANARALKQQYEQIGLQEIALDAEITYVGAPTTEYDFSGYGGYGVPDGTHRVDEVLRTLTQRRRELSRRLELDNMDRRIGELDSATAVAQAQQAIARTQVQAAEIQQQIAALRRQQAQQQLVLFDSQEFTPDLWNRLANEIKSISQSYLQQAIIVAQRMEQAYEFEIGEPVNVIKPSYTHNELSGLLAGDFLLRDIDSFTVLRIIAGQKKQPMKEVISLADRYPIQFLREFQRNGRMEFRTDLSDFDRSYPGAYQQRIKRAEVVVEGLIGHGGIHGSLTNTGLCLTRMRNGGVKMRLLKPETLLLSSYRIGPDSAVFSPGGEMLAIFENSPVTTSWILELRPTVNDLIYNYISDVKLILYYEAFFDPDLTPLVLEELSETQPLTGRRTVALRYELFDEFFAFQDTGEVQFTLRNTMLPFTHRDPTIRELTILVETEDGVAHDGLVVRVATADGISANHPTDVDGAISSGGTALDAFVGRPLLQEWTISIPKALNRARFNAGFEWSQVRNLVLVTEYDFTPLRLAGEPFIVLRDRFETNTLAAFDVVDDPAADQNGPSNWVYNAAEQRIEEQAALFGDPPGGAVTGPNKPGAYLVRQIGGSLPAMQDFLLTCRLQSTDNQGIGLVFRWQDIDNFYFFLMDSQRGYRRIGKKVGGVFQELDTPAVDPAHGYVVQQPYSVRVRVKGNRLRVYLNGDPVLKGQDASLPSAGRVGFYVWGNNGAQFNDLQVAEL